MQRRSLADVAEHLLELFGVVTPSVPAIMAELTMVRDAGVDPRTGVNQQNTATEPQRTNQQNTPRPEHNTATQTNKTRNQRQVHLQVCEIHDLSKNVLLASVTNTNRTSLLPLFVPEKEVTMQTTKSNRSNLTAQQQSSPNTNTSYVHVRLPKSCVDRLASLTSDI